MAEEVDWYAIHEEIGDILQKINDAVSMFCEAKWFKACITINEKVVPILIQLMIEADARLRVKEMAEETPEFVEGKVEEERELLRKSLTEEEL